jgi:hypothetical protein
MLSPARLPRAVCAKGHSAIPYPRVRVHPRLRTFPGLCDSVLSGSVPARLGGPLWQIRFSLFSTTSKLLLTHHRFLRRLFSINYKSLFRQLICFHNLLSRPGACPPPARRGEWRAPLSPNFHFPFSIFTLCLCFQWPAASFIKNRGFSYHAYQRCGESARWLLAEASGGPAPMPSGTRLPARPVCLYFPSRVSCFEFRVIPSFAFRACRRRLVSLYWTFRRSDLQTLRPSDVQFRPSAVPTVSVAQGVTSSEILGGLRSVL